MNGSLAGNSIPWSDVDKVNGNVLNFIHDPALESKGHDMCSHCRIELAVGLRLVGLDRDEVARQTFLDVE